MEPSPPVGLCNGQSMQQTSWQSSSLSQTGRYVSQKDITGSVPDLIKDEKILTRFASESILDALQCENRLIQLYTSFLADNYMQNNQSLNIFHEVPCSIDPWFLPSSHSNPCS